MSRREAEQQLIDALTVRDYITATHPAAEPLAQRLVEAACLQLHDAQIKEEA